MDEDWEAAIGYVVRQKVKGLCSQPPDMRFLSQCSKDHYQRSHFLYTPPLKAMRDNLLFGGLVHVTGEVVVACVPKGLGKTTACLLHMEEQMKKGHNCLCFSPVVNEGYSKSYFQAMLSLLGVQYLNLMFPYSKDKYSDAMGAMLYSLAKELTKNFKAKKKEAILYLDGFFMKQDDDEGKDLLLRLEWLAKTLPLVVVVLASSAELADRILMKTSSRQRVYPMLNIWAEQDVMGPDYQRPDPSDPDFCIHWSKCLPMRWETDHLIQAVAMHPSRLPWSAGWEEDARAYLDELPIGPRYAMSPEMLLRDQIFVFVKGEFLNHLLDNQARKPPTEAAIMGRLGASLSNLAFSILVGCHQAVHGWALP